MEDTKPTRAATRRQHGPDLKRRVLDECAAPGASVAQVAMAHGLNANLVHKWRRLATPDAGKAVTVPSPSSFVPVALPALPVPAERDIRVELRRGALAVNVSWPMSSSAECAAWLRELLR